MGPILYCGDPHGEFRHIVKAAMQLHASAVILLGDMEPSQPLHDELEPIVDRLWFIHQNGQGGRHQRVGSYAAPRRSRPAWWPGELASEHARSALARMK